MPYGIAALAESGVPASRVLNTLSAEALVDWIGGRRAPREDGLTLEHLFARIGT